MVAILLSAACVASRRLQVTVRLAADPDVFVGGWNCKARDSLELPLVRQRLVAEHVDELVALPYAPDARTRVGHVDQAGGGQDRFGLCGSLAEVVHVLALV